MAAKPEMVMNCSEKCHRHLQKKRSKYDYQNCNTKWISGVKEQI